mgnify:CR=1 FL=1
MTTMTARPEGATFVRLLVVLGICHLLNDLIQALIPAIYPILKAEFALDLVQIGMITLTFQGSNRVSPNYNVMGVAKAALEASTRYLAADLGPQGIRVNAVSAGPMRTLSGAVIGSARAIFKYNTLAAPLRRGVELDELGGTALYLLSDLGGAVTGEIHYVDCGFNALGMPQNLDEVLAAMGPAVAGTAAD